MFFSSCLFLCLYSFGKFSQLTEYLGTAVCIICVCACVKTMVSTLNMQTSSVAGFMVM